MLILSLRVPRASFADGRPPMGELRLPFELRQKSRLRATVARGELAGVEVGIDLPRNAVLRGGDRIATADGGTVLAVAAAAEQLLHVAAADAVELARIAYHLGNRHVPLQIGAAGGSPDGPGGASGPAGWLRLQLDHVLEQMVVGLGGRVEVVSEPFEPEAGAYSHAHAPGAAHADDPAAGSATAASIDRRHAPRIHDFTEPDAR